jgi:large repetitive protein
MRSLLLVATGLLLLAAGSTALSNGAFTATSANTGSSFSADASFPSACTAGSVSAVADFDTTIRSSGAAPSGNATTLTVGTTTGGSNTLFRALVHFPMPAIPSGCSLDSAALRMTNSSAATGRTIDVHQATGSWTESTVWPGPSFGGVLAGVAAVNGTLSWNVTTAAAAIYAGTANNGFVVKDRTDPTITENGNKTQTFASSEAADASLRPVLVVSYE